MAMIELIVTDFSRVLLFPTDDTYTGGLNQLNNKLLEQNPNYDFWHFFELNEELLNFYVALRIPLYIFTSETIQDHPAVKDKIEGKFRGVMSAKTLGITKSDAAAYSAVAKTLNIAPERLLYIDDNLENVEAAEAANCAVIHHVSNEETSKKVNQFLAHTSSNVDTQYERDFESVIRYLEIHDPKNADREYAVQLLGVMQQIAKNIVDTDVSFAELLEQALKKSA